MTNNSAIPPEPQIVQTEAAVAVESYWSNVFRRFRRNKLAVASFFVLLIIVLMCIFVPIISPYTIEGVRLEADIRDQPPAAEHWLGTDKIGRDIFTRLFYGGRISLGTSLAATAMLTVVGVILGSVAGYYRGVADAIIMRLSEMFMSFPFLIMCITLGAVFGAGPRTLIFALTALAWPSICRIVRGQILTLRELEYMEACEALGLSDFRRMFRHLFPNVLAYVIVYATLSMASVILTESALSFLGLGVAPPTPSWGNMIEVARELSTLQSKWWYWVPPGIMISLSVLCFNILGDGLRDAVDPKMKR
jgi:peptide/nickel transport system permease protein